MVLTQRLAWVPSVDDPRATLATFAVENAGEVADHEEHNVVGEPPAAEGNGVCLGSNPRPRRCLLEESLEDLDNVARL
jgi:hypothetical protein